MRRLAFPPAPSRLVAVADAFALLGFTVVGILTHEGTLPARSLLEDALPLLVGWFAAAAAFRLYRRRTPRALLLTWAVGIPVGVALRAAVLGRLDEPNQLAFLATTLVLSLVLVLCARTLLALTAR